MDVYHVIGLMSGTSLDGLDVVYCTLHRSNDLWKFKIHQARTVPYNDRQKHMLSSVHIADSDMLHHADRAFGQYMAEEVKRFIADHQIGEIDLIASHGHTVAHMPERGISIQIGDGRIIANTCGIVTINDFRSKDISLGGQGAPLVPLGDHLLFAQYAYCLNLGGFANISYADENNIRRAYDICPLNIILNRLARKYDKSGFDNRGGIAMQGRIHAGMVQELNQIAYYNQPPPKSLAKEWLEDHFLPVLANWTIPVPDQLASCCEHFAQQIGKSVHTNGTHNHQSLLITGGGAYNDFLIQRIKKRTNIRIIIPKDELIRFKESLIFSLLGVLRIRGEVNCFSSVTGARRDSCCGAIHFPDAKTCN